MRHTCVRTVFTQLGGRKAIDIEQVREVIKSMADTLKVRPGTDGVPVAELSLNEETPLAQVAGGSFHVKSQT